MTEPFIKLSGFLMVFFSSVVLVFTLTPIYINISVFNTFNPKQNMAVVCEDNVTTNFGLIDILLK